MSQGVQIRLQKKFCPACKGFCQLICTWQNPFCHSAILPMGSEVLPLTLDGLPFGDVAQMVSNRCKHCGERTGSRTLTVLVQRLPDLKTLHLYPHFKMLFEM